MLLTGILTLVKSRWLFSDCRHPKGWRAQIGERWYVNPEAFGLVPGLEFSLPLQQMFKRSQLVLPFSRLRIGRGRRFWTARICFLLLHLAPGKGLQGWMVLFYDSWCGQFASTLWQSSLWRVIVAPRKVYKSTFGIKCALLIVREMYSRQQGLLLSLDELQSAHCLEHGVTGSSQSHTPLCKRWLA